MYIAGSEFTSLMDKICMEKYKIPEIILMENAANAGFERILKFEKDFSMKNYVFICGCGNNGGDGFAIARKLYNIGKNVKVVLVGNKSKMSSSAMTNFEIIKSMGVETLEIKREIGIENNFNLEKILCKADVVLDCIFGAGLNRDIKGEYRFIIEKINFFKDEYGYKVISIDIPSGINGSSGEVMGTCVYADYTITFEFFKKGFLRYDTEKYLGTVYTESIGIPYKFYNEVHLDACFINEEYVLDNLIVKEKYAHKGDFGKVAIIAGSNGYYGAAYLATSACVSIGAGLTTLICNEEVQKIVGVKLNEAMTCLYSDTKKIIKLAETVDAVGIGPGLGNTNETSKLLRDTISLFNVPIIIDADGINVFEKEMLKDDSRCILTPHIGEFSRLIGVPIEKIQKDRIKYVKEYAYENDVIIVLKGKNTIVSDGVRTMVNTTGNNAMANGGMGDTLTGMITSLCAQGYEEFTAATIAVYLHGECGDRVHEKKQVVSASELIKEIPNCLKIMYNKIIKQ